MSNLEPTDPMYLDEATVRTELAHAFEICTSCRRCVDLCPTFPEMFELVERFEDRDAGRLTPGEQDDVMQRCYHCTRCTEGCPFIDGGVSAEGEPVAPLDFAALAIRAAAMRRTAGHIALRDRVATTATARGLQRGGLSAVVRRTFGGAATGAPGSLGRRFVAATAGWAPERLLPPRARQRFSTWFRHHDRPGRRSSGEDTGHAAPIRLFPTCIVEYHAPHVGQRAVEVYERNAARCELVGAGCCGAPSLDAGRVDAFTSAARRNIAALADLARAGQPIVVAQSTCAHVMREQYPRHAPGDDADAVASAVVDLTADLAARARDGRLDLPAAPAHAPVVVHSSCRGAADAAAAAELLDAAGAQVEVVRGCSGVGGGWGYRSANVEASVDLGHRLLDAVGRATGDAPAAIVGSCHLSNCAVGELGAAPGRHPVELLASWYDDAGPTDQADIDDQRRR